MLEELQLDLEQGEDRPLPGCDSNELKDNNNTETLATTAADVATDMLLSWL